MLRNTTKDTNELDNMHDSTKQNRTSIWRKGEDYKAGNEV